MACRLALALGLILFVAGMAAAIWRAANRILLPRLMIITVTALVILLFGGAPAVVSMAIALAGILIIAGIEQSSLKVKHLEALES